jgi:hypothetical protein
MGGGVGMKGIDFTTFNISVPLLDRQTLDCIYIDGEGKSRKGKVIALSDYINWGGGNYETPVSLVVNDPKCYFVKLIEKKDEKQL